MNTLINESGIGLFVFISFILIFIVVNFIMFIFMYSIMGKDDFINYIKNILFKIVISYTMYIFFIFLVCITLK